MDGWMDGRYMDGRFPCACGSDFCKTVSPSLSVIAVRESESQAL